MKKLFTLLMLLVAIVTGAQAEDVKATWTFESNADGLTITNNSGASTARDQYSNTGSSWISASGSYCLYANLGSTKGASSVITTNDSYDNISKITLKLGTTDRGKTEFALQVSPFANFSSNVTNVQAQATVNTSDFTGGTINKNTQMFDISYTLETPVSGYVRLIVAQASGSNNKKMIVDDLEITYTEEEAGTKYAVSYAAGEGSGSMTGTEKAEGAQFYLPASTFTTPEGKMFTGWLCDIDETVYAAGDQYTMTAAPTTFTAQYANAAQKIIYSLVDGIGSAAVTADDATVTEGTSLVLTNSGGRITITAATGETFQNGDAISFSGTVGNTARPFGIKYGASSASTDLSVAAGQPCYVSGTLSLSENSTTLVMGRSGGTTTTMTDFVISRTVGVSSESIANVYINGVSATEGTDYTVSGNTITLSKTYLVCPVVRIVGNATFADETTGKTNHAVTLALDEDTYTGTTTVAGTTYTVNAPYKAGESIGLSSTDGYNYGFGGYCAPENFTVTGGTAYAAKIVNNKIVLTSYDTEYIPKNTGVIIAGDKGATVTITYTATTTPNLAFPDNDLKGTNARTLTATLKGSAAKFLTLQKSTSKFIQYTGEYFPANRAYLLIESASAPESLEMVFADEATAIKEVNADENANSATPVKVIKNGKLYIGNFNVAGQQVK